MSAQNNGGPAFPTSDWDENDRAYKMHGMTLRDYFAAKALQGFLADPKPFYKLEGHETIADSYAQESYIYADAMLKAREK